MTIPRPGPTMVDCFAGAGGLSLGLANAGFTSAFAFDADRLASETYNLNMPGRCEAADAAHVTPAVVANALPKGLNGAVPGPTYGTRSSPGI